MKQQLRFLLLTLLCAVFSTAWGAEEKITFSAQGYSNGQAIVTVTASNFAITFDKGTNSSNAPKYYDSGAAIRAYGGNTFTVTSENDITKIVITFGSSDGSNAITANTGTYSNGTWTGSAKSVTFTVGGTSGNRRLSAFTVTTSSADEVAKPVITPDGGNYFQEQKVTITAAEGCKIYYTTNGTEPTTSNSSNKPQDSPCDVYIPSNNVESSTTVKAIAVKDGVASDVAEATFYLVNPEVNFSSNDLEISGDGASGTLDIISNLDLDRMSSKTTTFNYYDATGAALSGSPDWLNVEVGEDFKTLNYNVQANDTEDSRIVNVRVFFNLREAESESYPATSGVYADVKITQSPKSESTDAAYKLFTGELTEGDYIIYYSGKAMKNTVSSNRLGYAEVTPENDVIKNPDASIIWHIAKSGDYLTIYNKSINKYAAGNGTKNQAALIEDGTDDKALWTASGSSTYDFVNKANAANSVNANLRNNGTNGFACYSTNTGGALSLYKYENASNVKKPTFTPNGGEFIGTQEVTITAEEGCSIYYTTNGDDPSAESTLYVEPFTINATTTVKAIAVKDGENSEIASAVFTLIPKPGAPVFDPESRSTIGVGQKVKITPDSESTVNGLTYIVNGGEPVSKGTNQWNEITISEDMVVDGEVTIEAYNTFTKGDNTVEGDHATAIYTVVNPVVTFETPASIFAESINVTLSASPEDAVIYYTVDGTDPTTSSASYSAAITLNATTTIKAIAVVSGVASKVEEATYTKNEAVVLVAGEKWTRINSTADLDKVVTDGDNVIITNRVISNEGNAKVAMPAVNSSGNFDNTGVTITLDDPGTGQYVSVSDESAVAQFTIEKAGSYYRFKVADTETYLCALTENKIVAKDFDNSLVEDYNATVNITDGKEDLISFTGSQKNNKYLRYNAPSVNKFRMYSSSSQQGVALYSKSYVSIIPVNLYEMPSEIEGAPEENTIAAQSGATVNLYRSLTAGVWNAICLPFDMTVSQANLLFGEGYQLQEFTGVEKENGNTTINFSAAAEFKAGVPYIVMPTQSVGKKAVVVISGVDVVEGDPQVVEQSGYTFQGFYNPTLLEAGNKQYIFIGANNQFSYPNADPNKNKSLRAFRCYFHLPEPLSVDALSLSVDNQGIVDSISLTEVEGLRTNTNNRVYSISGQCVGTSTENLPKGIYIVNGRKFIVK